MLAITIFFEGSLCQRRDWAALNPLFLAAMIRQNRRIRRDVFEGVIQDQGDQIGRISWLLWVVANYRSSPNFGGFFFPKVKTMY
jgi:hypothetical protein